VTTLITGVLVVAAVILGAGPVSASVLFEAFLCAAAAGLGFVVITGHWYGGR
jgi:hypothetical protein